VPDRHHFRIFGIPVRVEPVFLVIMAFLGLQLAEEDWRLVLIWVGVAFVSILVHELGHALTLKAFGQDSEIHLQGFGGVTISRRRLSRGRSIAVSVAGSISALVLLWLPMRTLNGSDWILRQSTWTQNAVLFAAYVNLWWSVANLLPIRPLDGGNVATELFGAPAARRISLVVALGGGIWALQHDQQLAGLFALLLAFQTWQEISMEQRAR
jgi:membrane-associated protease RseP (regulator of RpoE activity)